MLAGTPETNTHILLQEFEYHAPRDLEEAVRLLDWDSALPIAGGTDMIVQMKLERRHPSRLVSLARIPELAGIEADGSGGVTIGAATRVRDVARSRLIRGSFQALVESCEAFSTVAIALMATIGGNLCNASPAADTAPALLVFDAALELFSQGDTRTIGVEDFFLGPGQTVLQRGEVLRTIRLKSPKPGSGSAFQKIGRVRADIAKVSVAVFLVRKANRVTDCRIALGAVAPIPIRARRAEAALAGRVPDDDVIDEVARVAAEEASPITDARSTAWYRGRVCEVLVRDAIAESWRRTGAGDR